MTLHEFVDWFYRDLAYKAPEQWPGRIAWFLGAVKARYPDTPAREEDR